MGSFSYGNPYPNTWTPIFEFNYQGTVPYTVPGATAPAALLRHVFTRTTTLPTATVPLRPVIAPATNIRIDGQPFSEGHILSSTTPTLTWDAPSTASASGYRVSILHLYVLNSGTFYDGVADLYTKGTSVQIPPELLQSGEHYVFEVEIYSDEDMDIEAAPLRLGIYRAYMNILSDIMTAPTAP